MKTSFATKAVRVLIAEEVGSIRQLLSDSLRNMGFLEITVVASGKDVFQALEHGDCDWIIMSSFMKQTVNVFHCLQAICNNPHLRHVRVSLLVEKYDEAFLPAAFSKGLLSWHSKSYIHTSIVDDLERLLESLKNQNWSTALVAEEYFRSFMASSNRFDPILDVEKGLLQLFPGSIPLLMRFAETQMQAGQIKDGMGTLLQACLLDERSRKDADVLAEKYAKTKVNIHSSHISSQNVLGIKTCVLIDPDTAVLGSLKKLLLQLGVPQIETFENGEEAWQWLRSNPEPDLILHEWKIPGLPGPLLLQRLRHHGFVNVPVNVVSSVIKPEESHLLRELGVANVIAKPFAPQSLFKSLIWTIQQHLHPTEQNSLQQKIKRLLSQDQLAEAERLKNLFLDDSRIKTSCKKTVEANYAFGQGQYRLSRDLAVEALKLQGDSLCLLNLIGKCLLKLGDNAGAVKIFQKAHSMSQMNIENLCLLALAQFDSGVREDSLSTIKKAQMIDRGSQMIGETECQMAVVAGDMQRAKAIIADLEDVKLLLDELDLRAKLLNKHGHFEECIKLYERTAEIIPAKLSDAKDYVRYNHALALARYGEMMQALDLVNEIVKRKESALYIRSMRLLERINEAVRSNLPLPYYDNDPRPVEANKPIAQVTSISRQENEDRVLAGEVCLLGIYKATKTETEQWKALFDNSPKFMNRSNQRDELAQKGF
ncbi:MAG: response regulator [Proteobacteria bacterium]|nr:MAG: response regulator [Pseudomonadota bacterium]